MLENVSHFLDEFDIAYRFALEPRNAKWFTEETFALCRKLGITLVSVDAPFARCIVKTSKDIYLRMHGRKDWYSYNYSEHELSELCKKIKDARPRSAFVFFNNDHDMLGNARLMRRIADSGSAAR